MSRRKGHEPPPKLLLQSTFQRVGATRFCGTVWDDTDPLRTFVVELLVDGIAVEVAVAARYEKSLKTRHGFSFDIDPGVLTEAGVIEARLANLGLPVGLPVVLHRDDGFKQPVFGLPEVEWLGGLRFAGAVDPIGEDRNGRIQQVVKAIIEGEVVSETYPDGWQNNGLLGKEARALAAFNLYLPKRFADGCVHRVHFIDHAGQPLPGSPLSFVAFADGLAAFLAEQGTIDSERFRGAMFDQIMPMSMPLGQYKEWCKRLPKPTISGAAPAAAAGIVLVGDGDEEASLSSLELQTRTWVALALPFSDNAQGFQCSALRDFLSQDAASCDFILFAKSGFMLVHDAIERIADAFAKHTQALIAYGDIALKDAGGETWPIAFSAFDYERLLEQGYCCNLFAVRRDALSNMIKGKSLNLFRLFASLLESSSHARVLHLPVSLGMISGALTSASATRAMVSATAAHLRTRGVAAKVVSAPSHHFPAVRVTRQARNRSVTIIIPIRNRIDLLRKCLESIDPAVKKSDTEIIIVDNESSDPETLKFLDGFEAPKRRVLRVPGAFNFSKLNNLAAKIAQGEYLCLLNNDVQALDAFWLEELVSRCVENDVAAVGAMLIWPSGVVQHGGVVLGPNLGATHAFNDRLSHDSGYADLLLIAHECSAVTAACMLTRRADFLTAGGLDEVFFPINFNDVDYCLKLRAAGKRVIFTPHAKLLHLESASRGHHKSAHRKAVFERELRSLRTRWLEVLLADPFYSPILSLDPVPYSALAWPMRSMEERWNVQPPARDIPSGM